MDKLTHLSYIHVYIYMYVSKWYFKKNVGAELEHDGLGQNSLIHMYVHMKEFNSRNYENQTKGCKRSCFRRIGHLLRSHQSNRLNNIAVIVIYFDRSLSVINGRTWTCFIIFAPILSVCTIRKKKERKLIVNLHNSGQTKRRKRRGNIFVLTISLIVRHCRDILTLIT